MEIFDSAKLICLRKDKKLSQEELSQQVQVNQSTIGRWESGKSIPDANHLLALCITLGINMQELFSLSPISF